MDYLHQENTSKQAEMNVDDSEPDWIKNLRLNSETKPEIAAEPCPKHFKKPKLDKPSNIDERISNLVHLLDEYSEITNTDHYGRSSNFNQQLVRPKIIYCSRTHSQLSQITQELKKTGFFKDHDEDSLLKIATSTASRNILCINKNLRSKHGSITALNEACNELISNEDGCPYFNRQKEPAFKEQLDILVSNKVLDVEDLVRNGTSSQCCPYFSSRYLVRPASLLITPYNTVLDKNTREAYGIDLSDSIVIFDEAHNIVDFVKQMNSVQIMSPVEFFDQIVECIDEYLQKYGKRLRGSNSSALCQLKIFFTKLSIFSKEASYGSYSVNDLIYRARIDSINFCRLKTHIEDTKLFSKVKITCNLVYYIILFCVGIFNKSKN